MHIMPKNGHANNNPGEPVQQGVKLETLYSVHSEPVFVDVYGHLGIDSKNRFRMKN